MFLLSTKTLLLSAFILSLADSKTVCKDKHQSEDGGACKFGPYPGPKNCTGGMLCSTQNKCLPNKCSYQGPVNRKADKYCSDTFRMEYCHMSGECRLLT